MRNGMNRQAWWSTIALSIGILLAGEANAQIGALFGRKESVPEINVEQLQKLKLDKVKQDNVKQDNVKQDNVKQDSPYVLVDVRTKEESSVSLIPGAITKFDYEQHRDRYENRTVICYCTSGYRSEQYTRDLIGKGIKAKNFKGSILEWCRAELPLVTPDGDPTNRVHTYSSKNRVPAKYEAVW